MPKLSDGHTNRLNNLITLAAVVALSWAFGLWRWHTDPNYCQDGPHWAIRTQDLLRTDTFFIKVPTFTHTCAPGDSYPKSEYKRL